MDKTKLQELFYIDKNYSKIKELLKNSTESWSFNLLAKIELLETNTKNAYNLFEKAGNVYGCAYCKFLEGNTNEARILLSLIINSSSATNWLLSLVNILENDYSIEPTYFQIRNYYEQDIEMLIKHRNMFLFNELIKRNNYFYTFNREIYKYSARVYQNNRYYEQAKILLKKSLEIFYNDPETHFLLGEIYEQENNIEKAKNAYKNAINANSEYAPAVQKFNHLSN